MQLSMDPAKDMQRLTITLDTGRLPDHFTVQVTAFARDGGVLASAGLQVKEWTVADLLPILLSEVAYGWLHGTPRECVLLPAAAFRARRKEVLHGGSWASTP